MTEPRLATALQSTWEVTSVSCELEQSANLFPLLTKARIVFPSTKRNCLLMPGDRSVERGEGRGQLTSLGLHNELEPAPTANTVRFDLDNNSHKIGDDLRGFTLLRSIHSHSPPL